MKNKINWILLIDDNHYDNVFHEIVIKEADCVERVSIAASGREALDMLKKYIAEDKPIPELIFLDINMPGMNGWEFIENLKILPEGKLKGVVLIMLSTSINPDDRKKAENHQFIDKYETKPITNESLSRILSEFFPEIC